MNEEDLVWERLKYGVPVIVSSVQFLGNGKDTKFSRSWLNNAIVHKVTIDDAVCCRFGDYHVDYNEIIFATPPAKGAMILVEMRTVV